MRVSDWSSDVCSSDLRGRKDCLPLSAASQLGGGSSGAFLIELGQKVEHAVGQVLRNDFAIDHAQLRAHRLRRLAAGQCAMPLVAADAGKTSLPPVRRFRDREQAELSVHSVVAMRCHAEATTEGHASSPAMHFLAPVRCLKDTAAL